MGVNMFLKIDLFCLLITSGPSLEDDDSGDMDTGSHDTPPDGGPSTLHHGDVSRGGRRRRKRTKEQVDSLCSYNIAEMPMCNVCTWLVGSLFTRMGSDKVTFFTIYGNDFKQYQSTVAHPKNT